MNRSVSPDEFGAIGDGSSHPLTERFPTLADAQLIYPFVTASTQTIDWAAITAAMRMLHSEGGGVLHIPAGKSYRVNTPIVWERHVDLIGEGIESSGFIADGCDCIQVSYVQGVGNSRISDIAFLGTNSTAIRQLATDDDINELNGVELNNLQFRYFDTAVELRTMRNVILRNLTAMNVNNGYKLIGKVLEITLENVRAIYADGPGFSGGTAGNGMYIDHYNYTAGAGQFRPEGIRMISPYVYGFPQGLDIEDALEVSLFCPDFTATKTALLWQTVLGTFTVTGGGLEVQSSTAVATARAVDLSSPTQSKITFQGVNFIAASIGSASVTGLKLGTSAGAGNQSGVSIENCLFADFTFADIAAYHPRGLRIVGNDCRSATPANNIIVTGCSLASPTLIERNTCAAAIGYDISDWVAGKLQLGINTINGGTLFDGAEPIALPFSAGNFTASGSMTWTVASGDVPSGADQIRYAVVGRLMKVVVMISTTTVGGTPDAALYIAVPGGRTALKRTTSSAGLLVDNLVYTTAFFNIDAGANKMSVSRSDGSNFSLSTDGTTIYGQFEFELA